VPGSLVAGNARKERADKESRKLLMRQVDLQHKIVQNTGKLNMQPAW
jgi:hypothetical protein